MSENSMTDARAGYLAASGTGDSVLAPSWQGILAVYCGDIRIEGEGAATVYLKASLLP